MINLALILSFRGQNRFKQLLHLNAIDSNVQDRATAELLLDDPVRGDDLTEEDVGGVDIAYGLLLQLFTELDISRKEPRRSVEKYLI